MSRVVVIAPPFLSPLRPSMGVSAVMGALRAKGIDAQARYLNLEFAERIGLDVTEWLVSSPVNLLLGEWIFSHRIRGPQSSDRDNDRWLDEAMTRLPAGYGPSGRTFRRLRSDGSAFVDDAAASIAASGASVVAFSTSFQQTCASLAIAARLKSIAPDTVIVFGGANCAKPMGAALLESFPQIDVVFSGEADNAFPQWVEQWNGTRAKREVIDCPPVFDMDALPLPDMDDFFAQWSASPLRDAISPGLVFESSRGCWWGAKHHCRFCGLNGETMVYRSKSPQRIVNELTLIAERHGIRSFQVVDNILDQSRQGQEVIRALAALDPPLHLFYEVKANLRHEQLVELADAGISHIQPGIESLDDDLLKSMEKGVSALQNLAHLRSCLEIGIRPAWNVLFRFPDESEDSYRFMETVLPAIEHLPPPTGHSPVRLDRFSPYFERAAELGFSNVRPFPAYASVFGLANDVLMRLAYFFTGTPRGAVPMERMETFTSKLEAWMLRGDSDDPPTLAIVDLGESSMIIDTRAVAVDKFMPVSATAARLLSAFRTPARIAAVIAQAGGDAAAEIDELLARRWLVRSRNGDQAVSVVCEPGWRRFPQQHPFPGGGYRPSIVVPERAADDVMVARRAEWFAALWLLASGDGAHCANPHLAEELRHWRELREHPALQRVRELSATMRRDTALKRTVDSADLNALDEHLGAEFDRRFESARREAYDRLAPLSAGIDPARDLATLTGSPAAVRIVYVPSLFLPPPQDGRHGAVAGSPPAAYLFFGLPLREDLDRYGINSMFLLTGGAHYAVRQWLDPHWPELAGRIEALGLGESLAPARVRRHLELALRARLASFLGATRAQFRLLAAARGLTLFDWFADWINTNEQRQRLADALPTLPDDIAAAASHLVSIAATAVPPAINLILMRGDDRPVLVVPDAWDSQAVQSVERAWGALRAPLLRYSEWERQRGIAPVIAFGSAAENPAVAHVLRHCELPPIEHATSVLALRCPDPGERAWSLAVALNQPSGALVTLEQAVQVSGRWALFDGTRRVAADSISVA